MIPMLEFIISVFKNIMMLLMISVPKTLFEKDNKTLFLLQSLC